MKRVIFQRTGKPSEVLEIENFILPPLGAGEVMVRLLAAPINPADLNTIEGTYGVKPPLPATPGIEGCGVVDASNDENFSCGDRVIFLGRASTWASHTVVAGTTLFKLSPEIDSLQAAMLKVNPATAWQLLNHFSLLKPGEWIVQNAGNSAVGRCVIQLARDLGIRTISFVRRPEIVAELRTIGADHVLTDDEAGCAIAKEVLNGANAALALNAVGGDSSLRMMKLLRKSGCLITYGAMGRKPVTIPNGLLIFRDVQIRGLWVSRWLENTSRDEVRDVYAKLAARVADGKLVQTVDSIFPLENISEALSRLEAPDRSGKILLTP